MSPVASRSYEVTIAAKADALWQSLVNPDLTEKYYFQTRVESDWIQGSSIRYCTRDGRVVVEGEILELSPPNRLVTTFKPAWEPVAKDATPSMVSWEIAPEGEQCRLKVTHAGYDPDSPFDKDIDDGWAATLNKLKNIVESASH